MPAEAPTAEVAAWLAEERWRDAADVFRSGYAQVHCRSPVRALLPLVTAGLVALKHKACRGPRRSDDDADNSNLVARNGLADPRRWCPVCDARVWSVVGRFPVARRTVTAIVCPVTGQLTDDQSNHPLALPNGVVVSTNAAVAMAGASGGIITCPITGVCVRVCVCVVCRVCRVCDDPLLPPHFIPFLLLRWLR